MYDERIDGAPVTADEGLMVPAESTANHATLPIFIDWGGKWLEEGMALPISWNTFDVRSGDEPALGEWNMEDMVELAERIIAGEEVVIQYNTGAAGTVAYMGVIMPIGYARADAAKLYADETDLGSFGGYLITAVVRREMMAPPEALLMIEVNLGGDNAGVYAYIN